MIQQLLRIPVSIVFLSSLNLGAGVEGLAAAETASTSMEVSLHVTTHCTASAEPLAFGSVTVAEAPARGAASSIEVACTENTPFVVSMDDGLHSGNGSRRAFDPATGRYVSYEIYTDAGHTQRWGGFGAAVVSSVADETTTTRLAAYGKVAVNAQVVAGDYRDLVTVMVSF